MVVALAVTVSLLTSKLEEPIQQEVSFPLRITMLVMMTKQAGNRLKMRLVFYKILMMKLLKLCDTVIISSLLNCPFRSVIAFKALPSPTTYGHSESIS